MGHSVQPSELSWAEILEVWRRKAWLILLVALIGAGLAYGFTLTITPIYEAESVILFDRTNSGRLGNAADIGSMDAMQRTTMVHSQMEVLRSSTIAMSVINRLRLADNPMFKPHQGLRARVIGLIARATSLNHLFSPPARPRDGMPRLVSDYLDHLSVRQDEDTYILRIDMQAADPELAARLANAHAAAYLDWLRDRRAGGISEASGWLQSAVAASHSRLVASEQAVEDFNASGTLVDANGHSAVDESLAQLTVDLAAAQANVVRTRARADEISRLQQANQLEGIMALSNSTTLSNMQASYTQARGQLMSASANLGPNHPELRLLRARSEELGAALRAEVQHLVQGAQNEAAIASTTSASLSSALERAKLEVVHGEGARAQLNRLNGQVETERGIYLSLLSKLRSFDGVDSLVHADASVLSSAAVPTLPSVPRRGLMTMFGFLIAGGLAAGTLAWRTNRQDVIRDTSDAIGLTGIRCLGVMPYLEQNHPAGLLRDLDPHYNFFHEELRSICAALIRGYGRPNASTSILVTSPLPSDGKSRFCLEIGRFSAGSGIRTLIVRTDIQRSKQSNDGLPSSTSSLDSKLPLFAVDWAPPTAFNNERELRRIVEAWKADYEFIIFDTPPLSAMAESIVLAPIVDATLLLARVNRTPRSLLANVAAQIERADGKLAGLVVTFARLDRQSGVVPSDSGYYFERNRSYYRRLN
ncbi:GumC family protein [Lichenicoccus roseus]|nr:exopolysaccharide transport family protein [Lichenicoccus roseus]